MKVSACTATRRRYDNGVVAFHSFHSLTVCRNQLQYLFMSTRPIDKLVTAALTRSYETSSSAIAKRPRDASYLSVVSFIAMIASIVQYIERSFFYIISYFDFKFTSTYGTIRFCSVIFGVTSSLAVIYTRFTDDHECV